MACPFQDNLIFLIKLKPCPNRLLNQKSIMKNISQEIINQSLNYMDYRNLIDELFAQGKTTGDNHSEAMLNYTKMNIARMKRLDRTTKLTEAAIEMANKIDRKFTWLVITEAWCGDAAQIIPVLNKMAEQNDLVDLKLIFRDEHPEVMDAFLTNGTRSIPILIILDTGTLEVLNVWGPRPEVVQEMVMSAKLKANSNPENSKEIWNEVKKDTQLWYAKDKTKSIQREVIEIL